jgi:adenylosuccinate lyase
VQRHAHTAWNQEGGNFRANLEADVEVSDRLSPQQIEACFSCGLHQSQLEVIWQRLGI